MRRFGLIGNPVGHSFSRGYFSKKFSEEGIADAVYENFQLETIDELPGLLGRHPDLAGLNVTIPYKQQVLRYLDQIDPEAEAIGAVNCIRIERRSEKPFLTGCNADAHGFEASLLSLTRGTRPDALVLGTGGASRAVDFILSKHGIRYRPVSRTASSGTIAYEELTPDVIRMHRLIINTTPLGMYPKMDTFPELPYDAIGPEHLLIDLVYNPPQTEFLRRGRLRGATAMGGYAMLVVQAERSWAVWNYKI
ncbi:MAG: shikimate dehydrogenase [Rikenellaceae bacterium]|jgi:shikimate dehydrogenase|nr:shikimate dehydrogenase [Rikenellaceae bacterium]